MGPHAIAPSTWLLRMADGPVKQSNPLTGVEVWTVPRRSTRRGHHADRSRSPIDPAQDGAHCPFCVGRMLETPPEKARLVDDSADGFTLVRNACAESLHETRAEFRRIPNLFEIVSYDFWVKNFGYAMPEATRARRDAYLASSAGRRHVLACIDFRLKRSGVEQAQIEAMPEAQKLAMADAFFGGGHEIIVARRHFVDGAIFDDELCSSGGLTPAEHYRYLWCTIDALREIFLANRYVRYVAVFQNWLQPAGASFDHLHKLLVAIDERGAHSELEIRLVRVNPNVYNEAGVEFAGYHNLVFAENARAIAFARFGHRFPALEIYSKSARSAPWNHSADELRDMSDLVHACHAAMGRDIPCNEEWHYKPPDADTPSPWRVSIKWRISNPAGFEGGTYIYVNTIDPYTLRAMMVARLTELRARGAIAGMQIGDECGCVPNCLQYNPAVRREHVEEPAFPPLARSTPQRE